MIRMRGRTYENAVEICGHLDRPGRGLENLAEIDYSRKGPSLDLACIIDVLAGHDLAGRDLLHVGVGCSALARRFSCRARRIVGLTIHPNEKAVAEELQLPNYSVLVLNKHGKELACLDGRFDYVIDNNLGSFACCRYHFYLMLDHYRSHLVPGGQVLTCQRGMDWTVDGNHEWKLTWDDLVGLQGTFHLRAEHITDSVYALTRL